MLGPKEPFDYGERAPLGDTVEWTTAPLGDLDPGGRIYDATMPDGRTVSVASNLDPGAIERVLSSLYVHAGTDDR